MRCIKLPPGDCTVTFVCAAGEESTGPGSPTQGQCLYISTSSRVFSVTYPTGVGLLGVPIPQTKMSIENLIALGNKELELDSRLMKERLMKSDANSRIEGQSLLGHSYELDPPNVLQIIQNILISRYVLLIFFIYLNLGTSLNSVALLLSFALHHMNPTTLSPAIIPYFYLIDVFSFIIIYILCSSGKCWN